MCFIYTSPLFDYVVDDVMLDVHVPHPLANESILCHVYRSLIVLANPNSCTDWGRHALFHLS